MRRTLYIIVIGILLTNCSKEYSVEDELFMCLKEKFSNQSLNLEKTLDTLETLYIKEGLIKSSTGVDYRQYYQTNIDTGMLLSLKDPYLHELINKTDLFHLNLDSCALIKFDKTRYNGSKFGKISMMIDSLVKSTGQIASSTVATSHLKILTPEDFKHPYYRANILLSLQFFYFNKYLQDDSNYIKKIPRRI